MFTVFAGCTLQANYPGETQVLNKTSGQGLNYKWEPTIATLRKRRRIARAFHCRESLGQRGCCTSVSPCVQRWVTVNAEILSYDNPVLLKVQLYLHFLPSRFIQLHFLPLLFDYKFLHAVNSESCFCVWFD